MSATVADRFENVPLAGDVIDYAEQIWQAGLGAWERAGKEGNRVFESLVKRGEKVEAQARQKAEEQIEDLKQALADLRVQLIEAWQKLEDALQQNIGCVLHRVGVPIHNDVEDLAQRVETLYESIEALAQVRQVELPKPAASSGLGKAS